MEEEKTLKRVIFEAIVGAIAIALIIGIGVYYLKELINIPK